MGNMGPPSRPVEKDRPTDMNELSDVLMGSGVDLKEEEAALLNRYNQDNSFNSSLSNNVSHGTGGLSGPTTNPSYTPYNVYSHNIPGGRDTFFGSGTYNQPAVSHQLIEETAEAERKRLLRRKAEMRQYHLYEPFLRGIKIQRRLQDRAQIERIKLDTNGLFRAQSQQPVRQIVYGPDKHERLVTLQGEDFLDYQAPLVEFLSLLSLAAEERIRSLVEDAAANAIARKRFSHGIVPVQMADLAADTAAVETATGLPTPGNSAVSPKDQPLKRMLLKLKSYIVCSSIIGSYSDVNKPPTPVSNGTQTPPKPTLPPNPLHKVLTGEYSTDRKAEEDRVKKRERRAAEAAERSGSASAGGSGAATPADNIPDIDIKKIPSRKELKKSEAKVSEQQQSLATSSAISMAVGGKRPAWMTGGAAASITNPMMKGAKANPGAASQNKNTNAPGKGLEKIRTFDFREDKEKGFKIELRDLIFIMEKDRKEGKTLAKAYSRRGRE